MKIFGLIPWLSKIRPAKAFAPGSKEAAVEEVLAVLRPAFKADGGDLTLSRITPDGRVILIAHGACRGCGASALTLQGAIVPKLKQALPWVTGVELKD